VVAVFSGPFHVSIIGLGGWSIRDLQSYSLSFGWSWFLARRLSSWGSTLDSVFCSFQRLALVGFVMDSTTAFVKLRVSVWDTVMELNTLTILQLLHGFVKLYMRLGQHTTSVQR
jgi:hypothetical protein